MVKLVDVKAINLQDANGNTCLHLARQFGWNDMYEKLIAKGANPNLRNNDGKTADQIIPDTSSEVASTDEHGYTPK
ncbi:MAG: ankyrin repeat domain-containing protein [Pseudomonadota bacterium]|nr:ankyrin repeat domain-containing protein [Pseudomonadota bacterium]